MKVLVTGAAGFIGSGCVLRARAVRPDWRPTVLDSMTDAANLASLDPVAGEVDVVKDAVTGADQMDELVAAHDLVMHSTADSHDDNSLADPWPLIDTNIMRTYQLIQAGRRHDKRLHHVSTDEGYGDLELDDLRSAIDASKLRAETDWRPAHPDVRSGLVDTIAWYRDNQDWWRTAKVVAEARYDRIGR